MGGRPAITDGERAEFCRPRLGVPALVLLAASIVLVALGLRVVSVRTASDSPLFSHGTPMNDAQYYDKLGREIAAGDWLGDEVYYLGPLYPYTVGLVYRLAGEPDGQGGWIAAPGAVRAVQAVQGALGALLVFLLAYRLGGAVAAGVAGALAATYGYFIFYDTLLMPSSQILFVHLVAIGVLLIAERRPAAGWWLLAGFVLALCVLAHGSALVVVAALAPWLWLRRDAGWRQKLTATALMAATFVPVIGAVTARNWVVGHDLVLVTSNAGKNLYIGNNPDADGAFGVFAFPVWGSSLYYYLYDIPRTANDPAPSEVSSYLAEKAWAFARQNPGAASRKLLRKALLFVNWFECGTNDHYYFARERVPVLGLPLPTFGLVAPLGLVALALALIRRWPVRLLVVVMAAQFACFTLVFVLGRYRLVTVACMMILVGLLVAWSAARIGAREWRALALPALLLVPAVLLVHVSIPGFDPSRGLGQQHVFLAESLVRDGRLDDAARELEAALEADFSPWRRPAMWHAEIRLLLGQIALERRLWDDARREFDAGLAIVRENLESPRALDLEPRLRKGRLDANAGERWERGRAGPAEEIDP